MKKIDRLGWAAGMSFVSFGARIGIRTNDPAILERIPDHMPPEWQPSPSPIVDELYSFVAGGTSQTSRVRRYNLLYQGAGRLARTMDLDEVFETLESRLRLSVAVLARRRMSFAFRATERSISS